MKVLAAFLVVLVVGCTATGPSYQSVVTGLPEISPGMARLIVYRQPEFVGSGAVAKLSLDGIHAGNLHQSGFVYYDIPAGRHELHLSLASQLFGTPEISEISFEAGNQDRLYLLVRTPYAGEWGKSQTFPDGLKWGQESKVLKIKEGGGFYIVPVLREVAEEQLKGYRLDR